jgi:hypothetical protein
MLQLVRAVMPQLLDPQVFLLLCRHCALIS